MSREQTTTHFHSSRRLNYGSIALVPLFSEHFPYNFEANKDMWHIPGRTIMSTDALVSLATQKGITVTISEAEGVNVLTTRLN